jgi:predicted Rossmann fold nucleotide-binding protein DprA/Smf involved in DNA uptake
MNIGIVGSRKFDDPVLMDRVILRLRAAHGPFTLVSGGAVGADSIAHQQWELHHPGATPIIHLPDSPAAYEAFGMDFRARAFGRNGWIVRDSDLIIAFFVTPEMRGGTLNTVNQAKRAGTPVFAHFPWGWDVAP